MININSLPAFQHHWIFLSLIIPRIFLTSFWLINRKRFEFYPLFRKKFHLFGKNTRGNLRWFFCAVRILESTNAFSKLAKFSRILCEIITQYRFWWDLELNLWFWKFRPVKTGTFYLTASEGAGTFYLTTSENWKTFSFNDQRRSWNFSFNDQWKLGPFI